MATHSSTIAWKTPGWKIVVGYSPWGRKELDTTERLHFMHTYTDTHRYTYRYIYYTQTYTHGYTYMHPHTDTHTYRYMYYAQINIHTYAHRDTPAHTDTHMHMGACVHTQTDTYTMHTDKHIHTDTRTHPTCSPAQCLSVGPSCTLPGRSFDPGRVRGVRHALPPCRGSQVKGAVAPGLEAPVLAVGLGAHRGQLSPLWSPIGPRDCSLAPLGPHAPLCQTRG